MFKSASRIRPIYRGTIHPDLSNQGNTDKMTSFFAEEKTGANAPAFILDITLICLDSVLICSGIVPVWQFSLHC